MERLLFIAHRVPYPPDKGDRVRAFHEIVALSKHFRVTLAALKHAKADADAVEPLREWCEKVVVAPGGGGKGLLKGALSLLRGGSVTEGYFRSGRLRRAILGEAEREPFALVIAYCSGVLPLALEVPAPRRIVDLVDVDSAKWASYAEASSWPKNWLYRREARGVRALELRALERCDAVLLVSDDEVRAMGAPSDKLLAVGNGVDLKYFSPRTDAAGGSPSLVFTGTMDYRPNVDGVCGFVRDVWPGLRRTMPDLTFSIVGRNPTSAVRRLEKEGGIRVTGAVSDVRPFLAQATMMVAPLTIARGVQNKVLEAMAMGRAVVASAPAIEGLDVTVGEDVLQADAPEEWHRRIVEVLSNESLRDRLERSARECVERNYDWDRRMEPLVSLCMKLADSGKKLAAAVGTA